MLLFFKVLLFKIKLFFKGCYLTRLSNDRNNFSCSYLMYPYLVRKFFSMQNLAILTYDLKYMGEDEDLNEDLWKSIGYDKVEFVAKCYNLLIVKDNQKSMYVAYDVTTGKKIFTLPGNYHYHSCMCYGCLDSYDCQGVYVVTEYQSDKKVIADKDGNWVIYDADKLVKHELDFVNNEYYKTISKVLIFKDNKCFFYCGAGKFEEFDHAERLSCKKQLPLLVGKRDGDNMNFFFVPCRGEFSKVIPIKQAMPYKFKDDETSAYLVRDENDNCRLLNENGAKISMMFGENAYEFKYKRCFIYVNSCWHLCDENGYCHGTYDEVMKHFYMVQRGELKFPVALVRQGENLKYIDINGEKIILFSNSLLIEDSKMVPSKPQMMIPINTSAPSKS